MQVCVNIKIMLNVDKSLHNERQAITIIMRELHIHEIPVDVWVVW
jgi:hypothetical protein